MEKMKIKIIQYGFLPQTIDYKKIVKYKSSVFEIIGEITYENLPDSESTKDYSRYLDNQWKKIIPKQDNVDIIFVITNVILEDNFYARRLSDNRIVFSFRNIYEYIEKEHIPPENVLLKELYEYSIYFLKRDYSDIEKICHDETRCCLYDMNGTIEDIASMYKNIIICEECQNKLIDFGFSKSEIRILSKEIGKIKNSLFNRMIDFVKKHPIISIFISFIFSICCNLISSLIWHIVYK